MGVIRDVTQPTYRVKEFSLNQHHKGLKGQTSLWRASFSPVLQREKIPWDEETNFTKRRDSYPKKKMEKGKERADI